MWTVMQKRTGSLWPWVTFKWCAIICVISDLKLIFRTCYALVVVNVTTMGKLWLNFCKVMQSYKSNYASSCCKFPVVYICQKLWKLVSSRLCYCSNKKGVVFDGSRCWVTIFTEVDSVAVQLTSWNKSGALDRAREECMTQYSVNQGQLSTAAV